MHRISVLIAFIISCLFIGCAGPQMFLGSTKPDNVKPLGIFICASSQMVNQLSKETQNDIVKLTSGYLSDLLNTSFNIILLNNSVPYESAFTKYPGSFYIDEKLIAKYASRYNCKGFLIVYYAFLPHQDMDAAGKDSLEYFNNLTTSKCSLYGWLGSANDASMLSRSHSMFNPFDNEKKYLQRITKDMFKTMLSNP